jgi:hypothetical protein
MPARLRSKELLELILRDGNRLSITATPHTHTFSWGGLGVLGLSNVLYKQALLWEGEGFHLVKNNNNNIKLPFCLNKYHAV